MWKAVLFGAGLVLASGSVNAQTQSVTAEVANLREDVRLVSQRLGEMALRVEQLERETAALKASVASTPVATYATVAQLNAAVVELNQAIKAGDTATAERVAAQIKKLGEATNAALDSVSKAQVQRPVTTPPVFNDDFPAEGISYTVLKGDTVATIARKTGAKLSDILNANKIADPSKIQVGQILFIPGGK